MAHTMKNHLPFVALFSSIVTLLVILNGGMIREK